MRFRASRPLSPAAFWLAGWALLAWAASAGAGLTPVQREPFQGGGTGGTANFPALTGTFYTRAVGPKLAGDTTAAGKGWSADTHQGSQSYYTTTVDGGRAAALGCASVWFWADGIGDGVTGHYHYLIQSAVTGNGYDFLTVACGPNGDLWYVVSPSFSWVDSGLSFPLHGWYELRIAWQQVSGSTYNKGAYLRAAGSGTWTTLYEGTGITNLYSNTLNTVLLGIRTNTGANGNYRGRLGMPAVYEMSAWSDRIAPVADVVDPPAGGVTWYVDPVGGSDTNDGVTATSAWQTIAKINDESQFCGMFPTTAGYASGDTLTVDTSVANLALGPNSLNLNTRGLNVVQTGSGEIQAWATLPNASFTLVSGAAMTYQHTLTESNPSCVLWENDRWLNKVSAASFTGTATTTGNTFTYPNVVAALEAVPGSFWTDGTLLYVHPFGDTNPATDGKVYTRSYSRDNFGTSAVQLLAPDLHLDGLVVRKTCLADMLTNDPVNAYCIQMNGNGGGTTLIENCACSYGSKHIFGFTDSSTARRLTVQNCTANQGSPYTYAGGQTPWVDYSDLTADADNQTVYLNCTTAATRGLIGSTAGQTNVPAGPTWLGHNNGSGRQFSLLRFVNCVFDSGYQEGGAAQAGAFQIVGGQCGGGIVDCMGATVDRCKSVGYPFTAAAGFGISVTNSVVICTGTYSSNTSGDKCAGTVSYVGCTVDMRGAADADGSSTALLYRADVLDLTWRNNILLGAAANTVIGNATSGDTLSFDHNAYQGAGPARGYNDGSTIADRTLAQWQALGQDAGSAAFADLAVLADASLAPSSPAIDLGQNIGPALDFTGTSFPVRNDAGAYEYPLPVIRVAPAAAAVTEGSDVNLTVQVAGNGPFSYQWMCDGVPVAGGTGSSLTLGGALPGQSGSYAVVVTNARGSITSTAATVQVSAVTFPVWQADHFTAAELTDLTISGSLADPNGNGLCNLLEYAFGGDPRAAGGANVAPTTGVVAAADGQHFSIVYRQLINAAELAYVVGVSSDLVTWDDSGTQTTPVGSPLPTGDGRTEWITAQLNQLIGAGPGMFLRVNVIDNPAPSALQWPR